MKTMLKHIVMMRLKSAENEIKQKQMNKLKSMLEELKNSIDVLDFIEVGLNFSTRQTAFDLVLVTHFKGETELDLYRDHPDHLKVLDYIREVVSETAVVDYLVD
jgi:hypothetical protein